MIVLDTNIISVLMNPKHPDQPIIGAWRLTLGDEVARITTISMSEILLGIAIMPLGNKRQRLETAANRFFSSGAALNFDEAAALAYVEIVSTRREHGRPIPILDAQIAAIARANGATVATRNVRDFEDCGVALVNPYSSAPVV